MNFLLDNDVPEELSYLLDHLGHRISRVREALTGAASDAAVLDYAFRHDLIVITAREHSAAAGRETPRTSASKSSHRVPVMAC